MMKVKYNTLSHRILLFARMKASPVTIKDVVSFSPKAFPDSSRVRKSMIRLTQSGHLSPCGENSWKITSSGIDCLYSVAKPYRGE